MTLDEYDILNCSCAKAVEQALYMADCAYTPLDAIRATGFQWQGGLPNWDDALYVLAYAHRRRLSPGAYTRSAQNRLSPAAAFQPEPKPKTRHCLKCRQPFLSTAARLCPECAKANSQIESGLAECVCG